MKKNAYLSFLVSFIFLTQFSVCLAENITKDSTFQAYVNILNDYAQCDTIEAPSPAYGSDDHRVSKLDSTSASSPISNDGFVLGKTKDLDKFNNIICSAFGIKTDNNNQCTVGEVQEASKRVTNGPKEKVEKLSDGKYGKVTKGILQAALQQKCKEIFPCTVQLELYKHFYNDKTWEEIQKDEFIKNFNTEAGLTSSAVEFKANDTKTPLSYTKIETQFKNLLKTKLKSPYSKKKEFIFSRDTSIINTLCNNGSNVGTLKIVSVNTVLANMLRIPKPKYQVIMNLKGLKQEEVIPAVIAGFVSPFLPLITMIAITMLVINGMKFAFSAGQENLVSSAKKGLKWVFIGLATILCSYMIIKTASTFFYRTNKIETNQTPISN